MLIGLFLKGWLIGFSIAMPVGPIGMICIQHALIRGMLYGLAAGLGAAFADAFYGALAGLGINAISDLLFTYKNWIQIVGVLFLVYLGYNILRSPPIENPKEAARISLIRVFLSTFVLTLTNPMTVLCFAGAYAGLGLCAEEIGILSPLIVTLGVFIGSAAWWLMLSTGVSFLGSRISILPTKLLNQISGGLILFFALVAGIATMRQLVL